jgi:hypothetical protein
MLGIDSGDPKSLIETGHKIASRSNSVVCQVWKGNLEFEPEEFQGRRNLLKSKVSLLMDHPSYGYCLYKSANASDDAQRKAEYGRLECFVNAGVFDHFEKWSTAELKNHKPE